MSAVAGSPNEVLVPPVNTEAPSAPPAGAGRDGDVLLRVRDLKTYFFTYDGVVRALDGVTYSIRRGETIGLVGETGCGKSVTAFSITRLVADPPGRIIQGEIVFDGANLLWGLEREAKIKAIRGTVRAAVKRRYRRIKQAQDRMSAIRGSRISMIFQEPMAALNPVFSISNQIGETLRLHRLGAVAETLLGAQPGAVPLDAATRNLMEVAKEPGQPRLRAAARAIADAVHVPSVETEIFYLFKGATLNPSAKLPGLEKVFRRITLSGPQRAYLKAEIARFQQTQRMRDVYLLEMRQGQSHGSDRRRLALKSAQVRAQSSWLKLPIFHKFNRGPLDKELFWQSVRLLEGVGIANPVAVARGYPHELSGGMIQRVMIAMALAPEPALLLADEPTTALDVTIQAQILELMRELKTRIGTSIMLITHDLGVVAEVCDRVCVMYAGKIVEVGPVSQVFSKPLHPYSQGLLASIPRLDDPTKKLESIPGSVPNLIRPPEGCRFHPRCPHAMEKCKQAAPPMTLEGDDHVVACWLYSGREVTDY